MTSPVRLREPALWASRFVLASFVLLLLWPAGVRAQGAVSPAWLTLPPLPVGWAMREADDTHVWLEGAAGELRIQLGDAGSAPVAAPPYHSIVAGRWTAGVLVNGESASTTFVATVRTAKGPVRVTAVGREAASGLADALELAAGLRIEGDEIAAPAPALDLSECPEARINPVGLFVSLPSGWRPKLDKRDGVFTLSQKKGGGTLVFTKASSSTVRDLGDAVRVAKGHEGFVVEPLFWKAPGSFRSWRLHQRKGEQTQVEELHLVRFKKLDEWSYHLVRVKGFAPATGMAQARSVLSRIKIIP